MRELQRRADKPSSRVCCVGISRVCPPACRRKSSQRRLLQAEILLSFTVGVAVNKCCANRALRRDFQRCPEGLHESCPGDSLLLQRPGLSVYQVNKRAWGANLMADYLLTRGALCAPGVTRREALEIGQSPVSNRPRQSRPSGLSCAQHVRGAHDGGNRLRLGDHDLLRARARRERF